MGIRKDGAMLLTGGTFYNESSYSEQELDEVWASGTDGTSWARLSDHDYAAGQSMRSPTEMTTDHWQPRSGHSVVVRNDGAIVLMGGTNRENATNELADVWMSADGGNTWYEMTDFAEFGNRAWGAAVVLHNNHILFCGGLWRNTQMFRTEKMGDCWLSEDGGFQWMEKTNNAWTPVSNHAMVVRRDGAIVKFGGLTGARQYVSVCFNPQTVVPHGR